MEFNKLEDLYIHELKDLYNAERQIVNTLPKMAQAASSSELENAFKQHLEQTKRQIERLEKIFKMCNISADSKECKGIKGIIEEGEELIKNKENIDPDVLDAGLISGAQKVEHYEMAGYGTVRTFAEFLGQDEAANLLQQTLDEEKQTDKKLTELAENMINVHAKKS